MDAYHQEKTSLLYHKSPLPWREKRTFVNPRLSGDLTSRDADPEADGLFVRGAVKARRALVNGLKRRLVAENAQATSRVRIYSVFDRESSRYGTVTPGHTLTISGNDIIIDPARDDEGVWLEKRLHVNSRRHSYIKVARGRIVKSDIALAEVVFDEAIPKGTYLLTLYTRCGCGTDFKAIHCRSEVSVKYPWICGCIWPSISS